MVLGRKALGRSEAKDLAQSLAPRIAGFSPTTVVFLGQGGAAAGEALASSLGVPAAMLDVRYPLSRVLARVGPLSRAFLLPLKELAYRLTRPAHRGVLPDLGPDPRVALIDDSASSGRTLRIALETLAGLGVPRERVCVAVLRCGPRARGLVDVFALEEPVAFVR
jgi:hypoxanthine phosphoribosyltransferase